jgi:two-component system KDP operon response regulator KdpE
MAHILVIDDEAAIRRFLRISLIAEGHQVSEAVGVTEGWRSIATSTPTW